MVLQPLLAAVAAWFGCAASSHAQGVPCPQEFLRDAELCDVRFIDPDRGWAVGDRGAIWRTEDGGRHWVLQDSTVTCRLESVWFLDDQVGWAVGGWTHPYTHKSSGVVLRTRNGGERWEQVPRLALPALRRVRFFDSRHGWAAGGASELYPAGVLTTSDGGLSWSSLPARMIGPWLSGDLFDPQAGIVGGSEGVLAQVSSTGLEPIAPARPQLRAIHSVRCLPARTAGAEAGRPGAAASRRLQVGWAVGDGGLAILTVDGGRSWQLPEGLLPEAGGQFDYRALAVLDGDCWIAGSPGTCVFHTPDGGRTWDCFQTGQTLPLRALTFLDANRGWAVGALGTILATRNGGRSWTVQQQGGARAALLGMFAESESIPLELLTDLGGDEGYLSVVNVVTRPSSGADDPAATQLDQRTHEAVVAAGGSYAETGWQFPVRYPGLRLPAAALTAGWERGGGARGREALEAYVVRQIRTWRPEVVVTEPASPRGNDPLRQMVNQAVLVAAEKAGDPGQFAEQVGAAGLGPWKVKKVFSSLGGDVSGSVNLTTAQLAPRLGGSLVDHARGGWQLLRTQHVQPPQTYGFRLLVQRLPSDVGRRDFFSGVNASVGGDCRRSALTSPPGDLRSLGRLAQQRRNTQQLLQHLAESVPAEAAWLGQVESLTRGLERNAGSEVLFELAQSLLAADRADLAAAVYDLMVRQDPAGPLCPAALVWLVRYHASGEAGWALKPPEPPASLPAAARQAADQADSVPARPVLFLGPNGLPAGADGQVATADHQTAAAPPPAERARRAAFYAQLIQNSRPALYTAPEVRFPLAVAGRRLADRHEADSYFHFLAGTRRDDVWTPCASSELWLLQPSRQPPKTSWECRRADQRPRLDGRLDDDTWKHCLPVSLASPDADDAPWPAAVMLAYDAEFLFWAASCRRAPGVDYPAAEPRRARDPDLEERDRIELLIDVDRDYATYYRLTVDHRGWAADACVGVAGWNPDWYIAAAGDDSSWTIEAAIPWQALVESPPGNQTVWAVGIQRVVPNAGFQSWTQPAAPRVRPEGFGLLFFR
ncbi:MAG: hypothetical protein GX575_27795 [Candidatus Anammoximicrobium sp.]|nr:hypothetical protein [Candidatus Anammoximicrobium sp.]